MKNPSLNQIIEGKWSAAQSLFEFFRYFDNWREAWSAYRAKHPLPKLILRSNHQPLKINHGPGDDPIFLFREIFRDRCYDPSWFYQPSSNDVVVDIGANMGMFMLYLAWKAPGIQVHCFKPSSRTNKVLTENVESNQLSSSIKVYPFAVSDSSGTIELKTSNISGHQSLFASDFVDSVNTEEVQMISLEQALGKTNATKINLLKIDVEGAEIEIIEGLPSHLWNSIERVVIEYHDLLRDGCQQRCSRVLSRHGFTIKKGLCDATDKLGIIYAYKP